MRFKGSCSVLLILLASACGGTNPSAPSAPGAAPATAGPPFSVSGTIFEHTVTGRRPLGGFQFTVTGSGGSGSPLTVDVTSDADGRYEATGFPGMTEITVSLAGYRTPCPLHTVLVLNSNSILNLDVVSDATLASTGIPQSLPTNFPLRVSGTVTETVTAGGGPVRGVALELFYGLPTSESDRALASTLSDAAGRYLVCVPPPGGTDQMFSIHARKSGYQPATQSVQMVGAERLDFELRR
jgi:hypothetical protein